MPVTTRVRNKQAHPGIPDLNSPCSQPQRGSGQPNGKNPTQETPSLEVQAAIIDKLAEFERESLTRDAGNASKPSGPTVTKKPRILCATKSQALMQCGDTNPPASADENSAEPANGNGSQGSLYVTKAQAPTRFGDTNPLGSGKRSVAESDAEDGQTAESPKGGQIDSWEHVRRSIDERRKIEHARKAKRNGVSSRQRSVTDNLYDDRRPLNQSADERDDARMDVDEERQSEEGNEMSVSGTKRKESEKGTPWDSPRKPPSKKRTIPFTPQLASTSQPVASGTLPNWQDVANRSIPNRTKTLAHGSHSPQSTRSFGNENTREHGRSEFRRHVDGFNSGKSRARSRDISFGGGTTRGGGGHEVGQDRDGGNSSLFSVSQTHDPASQRTTKPRRTFTPNKYAGLESGEDVNAGNYGEDGLGDADAEGFEVARDKERNNTDPASQRSTKTRRALTINEYAGFGDEDDEGNEGGGEREEDEEDEEDEDVAGQRPAVGEHKKMGGTNSATISASKSVKSPPAFPVSGHRGSGDGANANTGVQDATRGTTLTHRKPKSTAVVVRRSAQGTDSMIAGGDINQSATNSVQPTPTSLITVVNTRGVEPGSNARRQMPIAGGNINQSATNSVKTPTSRNVVVNTHGVEPGSNARRQSNAGGNINQSAANFVQLTPTSRNAVVRGGVEPGSNAHRPSHQSKHARNENKGGDSDRGKGSRSDDEENEEEDEEEDDANEDGSKSNGRVHHDVQSKNLKLPPNAFKVPSDVNQPLPVVTTTSVPRPKTLKTPNANHVKPVKPPARAKQAGDHGDDEDTESGETDTDMHHGRRKRTKARKFRNEDLPGYPNTAKAWREGYLPLWHDFIATLSDPWSIADELDNAQTLWMKMFPKHSRWTVARKDEPVFFLTKQRTYEWRKGFASRAEKAVAAFFDRYAEFDSAQARARYVGWVVPDPVEYTDRNGNKCMKPVLIFPYMWKDVDESNPVKPVGQGAFLHECILDTLAHHLEVIHDLPEANKQLAKGNPPRGALGLATVAVERAFRQWSSGEFVMAPKGEKKFSGTIWSYATNEVMNSVDYITDRRWGKIIEGAKKYVGAYQVKAPLAIRSKSGQSSARALCLEDDSE